MTDASDESVAVGAKGGGMTTRVAAASPSSVGPDPIWQSRRLPTSPFNGSHKIKTNIDPRLFVSRRAAMPVSDVSEIVHEAQLIEQFAALAAADDNDLLSQRVNALMAEGTSAESIFLDWLTPSARYLGTLWETDAADFATVTLGMSRLQRVLRQLGETFADEKKTIQGRETALLTTVSGEQHSFGLSMVSEFFRREGWNICAGPFESPNEIVKRVRAEWFDIAGFSVSSERGLDDLRNAIRTIRAESRNHNIGIILGGPMLAQHPELVGSVGADMMSIDATLAPQQARDLVDRMNAR